MLTDRDTRLLTCLTHQLKVLTLDQVAEMWFRGVQQAARRRLEELREAGFVTVPRLPVEPLPEIAEPLATWEPGQEEPDFGAVVTVARARWTEPATLVPVVMATQKAARLSGGKVRTARLSELSHDRALAQVYRLKGCPPVDQWRGEAVFPKVKGCVPDSFCEGVAIDFVGKSYGAEDLVALHESLAGKGIPYELW